MRLFILLLGFLLSGQKAFATVNETTSRHTRTTYMCRVATENALKPVPAGLDHFRMSSGHYGVADLYGDGTIDFFFGFSDDTFSIDRIKKKNDAGDLNEPLEPFIGNRQRSFSNHQYSFYSPNQDFNIPQDTRFLIARTFAVQDFNGDGVDDFVVAQFGRDYEPWSPRAIELFLSSTQGYTYQALEGGLGQNHGAAAGDIDNDGDVDLIVSRIVPDTILFYENDGKGNFSLRQVDGVNSRSEEYSAETVALWDVDSDGNLDFLVARKSTPFDGGVALVFWGADGFSFNRKPSVIYVNDLEDSGDQIIRNGYFMRTAPGVLDFEFSDFDKDGTTDVAIVTQSNFYRQWQISIARFNDRKSSASILDRSEQHSNFSIFWITACDLQNDGDVDLVYEHFGQDYRNVWKTTVATDTSRMDKYVWINDGLGVFQRYLLESPIYFSSRYKPYLQANAEWLGVAQNGYLPSQVYFPNILDERARYLHPFYSLERPNEGIPYMMNFITHERFPSLPLVGTNGSVAKRSDGKLSPRAQAIIDAKKKR